jgi:hypothetical protein
MSEQITNYLKNRHTKMSNGEEMHRRKISLASAFSYAAGILILASGIIAWILLPSIFDPLTFSQLGIDKQQTLIGSYTFVVPITGVASGIAIIFCASLNHLKPKKNQIWGVGIIIFSLIALIGMGGFVLGTVLGLIGGILSLIRAR